MAEELNFMEDFDKLFSDIGGSDDAGAGLESLFADTAPAKEEDLAAEEKVEAQEPAPPVDEHEKEDPVEEKEEPAEETAVPSDMTSDESGETKEEVEPVAEESAETEPDTAAEAPAEAEEDVEADAPTDVEAKATEPAEPVVEVKVEKKPAKKQSRRTKKTKAKAEEPEPEEKTVQLPDVAAPINETFVKSLILTLGPEYEKFKQEVNDRMNNIVVQPGMTSAVIDDMIGKNNQLDKLLFVGGQGYFDAYTSLTASKTGFIDRLRKETEMQTKGNASEKRLAADLAVMNYTFPATGEKINLLQYANALKQATGFVSSARNYVKSTSIALNMMRKVA